MSDLIIVGRIFISIFIFLGRLCFSSILWAAVIISVILSFINDGFKDDSDSDIIETILLTIFFPIAYPVMGVVEFITTGKIQKSRVLNG